MKPTAIEAALITEHPSGLATFAVNEDLLDPLSVREQEQLLKSLLVLARETLLNELESLSGHERISISEEKEHAFCVMQLRILVTPQGKFSLLTYFGNEADPSTRLHAGLTHALQVIATCEKQGR